MIKLPIIKNDYAIYFGIIILASLLFMSFNGNLHLFDWDEINFAESAREMIISGNYITVQVDYVPFWEKPPLFIWMQVVSMKIFGINEFAARFPNTIAGIITLLVFFNIGKKLFNKKFALIWLMVYIGSILPFLYFKSGIIDPWFNLFIFLGIYYFILSISKNVKKPLLMVFYSACSIGLGILTKGPVALLLFGLTAFIYMILYKKYKQFLSLKVIGIYVITVSFVGGFWFILQILDGNYNIIVDFIEYQIELFTEDVAGHAGFPGYHFVVLFFGVFPASIFAIKSFAKSRNIEIEQNEFKQWMIILFWVVLILFSIVNTKIVHYSSMSYFPLSFLATLTIYNIFENKAQFNKWIKVIIAFIAVLFGSVIIALQYFVKYKDEIIDRNIIDDEFAVSNLQADVYWSGFEFLIGIFIFIAIFYSLFIIKSNKNQIISVFVSTLIFLNLIIYIIIPRVEKYTQNAAISFYKDIAEEDCYIRTYYLKTYAHYFYGKTVEPKNKKIYDFAWITEGEIDKPVYMACKITRAKQFEERYKNFKKIKSKNGYVLYYREKIK